MEFYFWHDFRKYVTKKLITISILINAFPRKPTSFLPTLLSKASLKVIIMERITRSAIIVEI